MPFSETPSKSKDTWEKMYTEIFRPIINKSKFGYECKRSESDHGSFTKDIVINLRDAYLVLADITDLNANVMWELGVRHSLSKRTIIVARDDFISQIPSDFAEYVAIPYETGITSYQKFETQINILLQKIEDDPEKSDSPVFNFIKEEELILSAYGRKQIINKLIGLMTEISENLELTNDILDKKKDIGRNTVTASRYHFPALEKLLTENYVNGGEEYHSSLHSLRIWILAINGRLNRVTNMNSNMRGKTMNSIMTDAQNLKILLTKAMHDTISVYSSVKSNSLKDVEPSVITTAELAKEFMS
jgi:hypothetical protein